MYIFTPRRPILCPPSNKSTICGRSLPEGPSGAGSPRLPQALKVQAVTPSCPSS